MEIKNLYSNAQTFCRLIEIGSFSGVANKYGISQSTVSRRISILEEDLGTLLLKRNTRNFEITEAGKKFYDLFINQEETLKETVKQFRNQQENEPYTIRISLPMGVIHSIISPHIPKYMHSHPNITLLAFYQNREVDLVKENYDFAILRHIPQHTTLRIRKLYKCQFNLYCTPKYIEKHGEPTCLDELSKHLIVGSVMENNMEQPVIDVTLPDGKRVLWRHQPRLMLNNSEPSLRMGKQDDAIIGGTDHMYHDELRKKELLKLMPDYKFATFEYYLVRLDNEQNPHVKEFIKFIESCFAEITEN